MKKKLFLILLIILVGYTMYSNELKNAGCEKGYLFSVSSIQYETSPRVEKFAFTAANETTAKMFMGIGIPVTIVGALFVGGGITLLVFYSKNYEYAMSRNIKLASDDTVFAMLYGGLVLTICGSLLLLIALPCLIYGAVTYAKIKKEEKVSMFLKSDRQFQQVGLSIKL